MNIRNYPDNEYKENGDGSGPINRFFKNLKKKNPALWAMTRVTLKKAKKEKDLQFFIGNQQVSRLTGVSEPLWEFKIPPKNKSGGVVRLYFAYDPDNPTTIMIFSAEIKTGKNADTAKIKQAEKRYRETYHGD